MLTIAAHWRVLQNDFVNYDDNDYVTANPIVQKGLTVEGAKWAFGNLHGAKTYWHPITWLSHMTDCQLFKLNPTGHHAMSLGFHAINVLLLFLVLERMTGLRWRSLIVAALWAVHPLQVDTVAWVTERKNLLSAFFWLLTMAAYLRYAAKPGVGRYLPVLLCMAVGLMCKPVLVTLPCALLLLDFWPLRRWVPRHSDPSTANSPYPARTTRQLLLEKVPLLMLSAVSAVLTVHIHNVLGMNEEIYGLSAKLK
ncbi:MAG: protein O-mannosyl-transferase, partial [Verrucomicrobiota bacterium]